MKKIGFMAATFAMVSLMFMPNNGFVLNYLIGAIGFGALMGGMLGYLDGDFQKPGTRFVDVDRRHYKERCERELFSKKL